MARKGRFAAPILSAILLAGLAIMLIASKTFQTHPQPIDRTVTPDEAGIADSLFEFGFDPEKLVWTRSKLRNGETLSTYLDRMDVPDTLLNPIIDAVATQIDPRRIPAGALIELGWSEDYLCRVDLSHSRHEAIIQASFDGEAFVAEQVIPPSDTLLAYYDGVVQNSVYETLIENGGSPQLAVMFFEVFQFTHYFAVDTRRGDRFAFVVEEIYRDGERAGYGRILAARYSGDFDTLTAVMKLDGDGAGEHFDEYGFTFRRDLLRVPFPAARITSTYGPRRHPVTGKRRMHHGVDLAADRGTPVVAAGRGLVTKAEWNHPGYGNWVHIKHGDSSFETRYGHFQKIAKGIRAGVRVEQGDVIGYVGSTGMTTGPHLHYEVFRDGKRLDPLRVKGSPVQRIEGDELVWFMKGAYRPWSYVLDKGELRWRPDPFAGSTPLPSLLAGAFAYQTRAVDRMEAAALFP